MVPRRECNQMDERLKFIAQLLDGQKWRRSAVSSGSQARRLQDPEALYGLRVEAGTDGSRRPYLHANQLPLQIETLVVRLKQDKPTRAHRRPVRCLRPGRSCHAALTVISRSDSSASRSTENSRHQAAQLEDEGR
jgi:hypothetical protein